MSFSINFDVTPNQSLVYQNTPCACSNVQTKQLNPYDTAKEFCNIYYPAMSSQGMSAVLHLFDSNVMCNYGGKECIGMHNVMVMIASEGVSRILYDKLNGTVIPINDNTMSLQVTGLSQGVTFWNQATPVYTFSEIFILTVTDGKIFVSGYSFKLI